MSAETMPAAPAARLATRHTYGWCAECNGFQVYAPAADGGRTLATFRADTDRERAHTNAAACTDRFNRGITPRQLALI